MNQRFILFRRAGVFYYEDTTTGKQLSLRTKDESEAQTLLHAKNESFRQPVLNLQIARAYMAASDPQVSKRTWQSPMDEMTRTKTGSTRIRHERAMLDSAFDPIRNLPIVETSSAQFLDVLAAGTVATNVFLRRIHNFSLDMGWLPWPVLPKRQWPKIRFKEKRAVTSLEHQAIVASEKNPERRAFYELCWHLGGAQSDVANLAAEDIDWQTKTVSFYRKKTGSASIIRFGAELTTILQALPQTGPLFPSLKPMREAHRATEFRRACRRLKISGITLHSYRYSWAERARSCGYPERFALEALGHQSKAVHRAYAKKAQVVISMWALPELDHVGRLTAIPTLIHILGKKSGSPAQLAPAAGGAFIVLAKMSPESTAPLIEALSSHDLQVWYLAAGALGQIGPDARSAIPALQKRLTDKDPHVRVAAAGVMCKIGGDPNTFLPVVIQSLTEVDLMALEGPLEILLRYKEHAKAAAPVLIGILNKTPSSANPTNTIVRDQVISALRQIDLEALAKVRVE